MPDKKKQLLWADLHNHNEIGYGEGSLDRSYQIAKGTLLDAYAFTVHGYWPDLPAGDAKIAEYHETGFKEVVRRWPEVREKANAENVDGQFVALTAFEWHSSCCGDYCVYFSGNEGEVQAAESLKELQAYTKQTRAQMIPHHIAYRQGWRGINWDRFSPEHSPVVDIFSEHGCSMEVQTPWPMVLHSMGGAERSQTALEQLREGRVFGVLASTDNHHGHPASYGEGLAGIWATDFTREGVLDAIRQRHCYAVTGDRIRLEVTMADGMMGDILPADTPRRLRYEIQAFDRIDFVKIFKNGECVDVQVPELSSEPPAGDADESFVVRLDFGWGPMHSLETVDWKIRLSVSDGVISEVSPCFAGGAGSVEKINSINSVSETEVTLQSFTSRDNARPTSGLAMRVAGSSATRIAVEIEAVDHGKQSTCTLSSTLAELLEKDAWVAIDDRFSAPKARLGNVVPHAESSLQYEWVDPDPAVNDWYLVKVQQNNGHIAWSSPIWCGGEKG